ncbi:MAG TPA: TVP38/TMEM64 family protein [Desulfuromonadales bacterium]|nr:TVP38/TMEM64 family protein [Desulfuromonadales bacterium]
MFNRRKILLLLGVAALVVLFFVLHLERFFSLEALKAHRQELGDFYRQHQLTMVAAFVGVYIAQAALSLPGATILSLGAGAVFGLWQGLVLVNIGATLGATLAFLFARYLFRDAVLSRFGARFERLNREFEREGLSYLLFLRLVPVFPFFLINLGAGVTALPLRTFFFGTLVGIIPGSFVYVNAGASLATIHTVRGIASPRVLGSFALLGLFSLVPVFYRKVKTRREQASRR